MSTVRSPSYPNIPLQDAVVRAGDLFDKERFNPISREAAAKLFGYSGLTGGSNTLLADLAAYGLIEKVGKGEVRVSQSVAKIIHPHDAQEYNDALLHAAYSPKLFSDLRDRFPDNLPSEENLEGVLVRMGFSAKGTKPAKKSFLETFRYLEEEGVSESHGDDDAASLESPQDDRNGSPATKTEVRTTHSRGGLKPNMKEDIYTLPEGDIVLQWPETLSSDSYEDLKMWTELMLRKIKRQVVSDDGSELI